MGNETTHVHPIYTPQCFSGWSAVRCWMVSPSTVATGRMGNICYHVTNIPQWRLVDGGHHTPVVTAVWCIDWVPCLSLLYGTWDTSYKNTCPMTHTAYIYMVNPISQFVTAIDVMAFRTSPHLTCFVLPCPICFTFILCSHVFLGV